MSKEGTKYISSNKIGIAISIPKAIWLIFLSMINGLFFGMFIYFFVLKGIWLILLKLVFAYACLLITKSAITAMKNRNRKLTYFIAIFISWISWYSMWAMNLSDFEGTDYFTSLLHPLNMVILFCKVQHYEGAFFLPDTLAFFLSIIILYDNPEDVIGLFCENCKDYYQSKVLYFYDGDSFLRELEQSAPGKYHFITRYDLEMADKFFDNKASEGNPYTYILLTLYTCPKCQKDSFITISKGIKYYEWKDGKLELVTNSEPTEIDHLYIDKNTADIIEEKYQQVLKKVEKKN